MSEKLMPFDEFMEALPCCDTVKVILTGCGESVFETKPIYEGICALANRRSERRGRWIDCEPVYTNSGIKHNAKECSECGQRGFIDTEYGMCESDFCPSCGAHMIGGEADAAD